MSTRTRNPEETRRRLIDAAIRLMLRQGYASTTVDQICAESGLTKGAFFHHYSSKEELTRAAVAAWGEMGTALYAEAWMGAETDPLAQLHRMLEIMASFTERPDDPCTCMVGMMSQELAMTHPEIREACDRELVTWTENVARLLTAAKKTRRVTRDFEPERVAWFLNSLWQGSMLVAKVHQSPALIRDNLKFARMFVDGLFETDT